MKIDSEGTSKSVIKPDRNCDCVAWVPPQTSTQTHRRRVAWKTRQTTRGIRLRSPWPVMGVSRVQSAPVAGCPRVLSQGVHRCSSRALAGWARASQLRAVVRASPRSPAIAARRLSCASAEHPLTASSLPRGALPCGGFCRGDRRRVRAPTSAARAGSPATRVPRGRRKAAFRSRTMCSCMGRTAPFLCCDCATKWNVRKHRCPRARGRIPAPERRRNWRRRGKLRARESATPSVRICAFWSVHGSRAPFARVHSLRTRETSHQFRCPNRQTN
jgi:hypothetical protein